MTEANNIATRLEAAQAAVRRAAAALDAGQEINLREVEQQADLAAAAATAGHGAEIDRVAARNALINLVADLNELQSKLRAESMKAAERLGRGAVSRRAYVAYGQRG